MKRRAARSKLIAVILSSAAPACLMATPLHAQSVCQGALTFTCSDGGREMAVGVSNVAPTSSEIELLRFSSVGDVNVTLSPGSAGSQVSYDSEDGNTINVASEGRASITADQVVISTNGFDSAALRLTGSSLNAQLNDLSAIGDYVSGVSAFSSGPIDIRAQDILTSGYNTVGIWAQSYGNDAINVQTGDIDASGLASFGLFAIGRGPITAAIGNLHLATVGPVGRREYSIGVNISGDEGGYTLSTGSITTTGPSAVGLYAASYAGPGSVTINGDVRTDGNAANGIFVYGSSVDLAFRSILTSGDNAGAATVVSTSRRLDVNQQAGSRISTTGQNADGIILSGAGIFGTLGDISATGSGSRALSATSSYLIDLTAGNIQANGDAVTLNSQQSPYSINFNVGSVRSSDGFALTSTTNARNDITIREGGTAEGANGGLILFGRDGNTVNINGSLQGVGDANAFTIGGANALINIGTSGSISGHGSLTGGDDLITNLGRFDLVGFTDFKAGIDQFQNLAGGSISATGTSGFTGLEQLVNAGVIDLVNNAAEDQLSLPGSYLSVGGTVRLDVASRAMGLVADRLAIGGAVDGVTTIVPVFTSLAYGPTGVKIVDTAMPLAGGSFVLSAQQPQMLNLSLRQAADGIYLTTSADPAVRDPALVSRLVPDLFYHSVDDISAALGSRDLGTKRKVGVWGSLSGSSVRERASTDGNTFFGTADGGQRSLDIKQRLAQAGVEYSTGFGLLGISVGHGKSRTNANFGTQIREKATGVAAYARLGKMTGPVATLLVKHDELKFGMENSALSISDVRASGKATGASAKLGYRYRTAGNVALEGNAGLDYLRSSIDGFKFGGFDYDDVHANAVRTSIGARAALTGRFSPFVGASLFHQSGGKGATVTSGAYSEGLGRGPNANWLRLEAGAGIGESVKPRIRLWGEVGDHKGWGLSAGFSF